MYCSARGVRAAAWRWAGVVALLLLLIGCEKTEVGVLANHTSDADAARVGATAERKAKLMGGYVPSFDHRLRSEREDDLGDGQVRRVAIIEVFVLTGSEVDEALLADVSGRGWVSKVTEQTHHSTRYLVQHSSVGQMNAIVDRESQLSLSPGATSTIYFSWVDKQLDN